jgi:hypothetical protein
MNDRRESYLEAHSALNGPFLASGLLAPAAIEVVCLTLGVLLHQAWFFVIMGSVAVPIMIASALLYRNWPTGVRIDESGISIGAGGSSPAPGRPCKACAW